MPYYMLNGEWIINRIEYHGVSAAAALLLDGDACAESERALLPRALMITADTRVITPLMLTRHFDIVAAIIATLALPMRVCQRYADDDDIVIDDGTAPDLPLRVIFFYALRYERYAADADISPRLICRHAFVIFTPLRLRRYAMRYTVAALRPSLPYVTLYVYAPAVLFTPLRHATLRLI